MKHKYVFFDVANTLLHKPGLYGKIREALVESGYELDEGLIRQRHKLLSSICDFPVRTDKSFYIKFNTRLLICLGICPDLKLAGAIYDKCSYLPWQPYDDTDELARIELPTGILSNWDESLEKKLSGFFSKEFFKVKSSHRECVSKPDLLFYKNALAGLDCEPSEVLYVGDSIYLDYAPAVSCGIDAVLIDREDSCPYFKGKKISSLRAIRNIL